MIKTLASYVAALTLSACASANNTVNVNWDKLPPLPPSVGQTKQPGEAGRCQVQLWHRKWQALQQEVGRRAGAPPRRCSSWRSGCLWLA